MKDVMQAGGKVIAGQSPTKPEILGVFIGYVIWLLVILFFGQYLWNNVLVKLVPAIKPVSNVWQILGVSILLGILRM